MKRFRIIENVYRKHVTVCVEPNRVKAEAWFREQTDESRDLSRCLACTLYPKRNGSDIYVWLRHKDDLTSLSHECLHCATWILDRIGQPFDFVHDEALTYLHEFLFASALARLGHKRFVGTLR